MLLKNNAFFPQIHLPNRFKSKRLMIPIEMYIDPNRRGTPRFSKLSGVAEDCARVAQHLSHQKLMQIHLAFPMPPNCPKRCELSDVLVRIFRLATVALCLEMRCLHKCSKHHEGSTSNLIETQIYLRILN